MDDASGLGGQRAAGDGPGAGLFRADGEIGLQPQQLIARTDQTVEPGLGKPHFLKEHRSFVIGQLADLFLDLGRDHDRSRPLPRRHFGHAGRLAVAFGGFRFLDVADVKHGLCRQQLQHPPLLFIIGRNLHGAGRFARIQHLLREGKQTVLIGAFLIPALELAGQVRAAAFDRFQIGEHQLGLDGFGIGDGIDPAFHMGDVAIFKAAQHMGDGIAFTDIGQELVAQTFALGRAAHQTGDIDKGHARGDDLLRPGNLGQFVQARVGHRNLAHIRLDRAEGEVRRLRGGGARQRVEERRFAHVRQPDDAHLEAHGVPLCKFPPLLGPGARNRKRSMGKRARLGARIAWGRIRRAS